MQGDHRSTSTALQTAEQLSDARLVPAESILHPAAPLLVWVRTFQRVDVENVPLGEFPKSQWVCVGSVVLLAHRPRKGTVLLRVVLWGHGFAGQKKESPTFTSQSKGAEGAQQPAGWAQGWLHPQLFEENLGLSQLPASLLCLCVL